MYYEVTANRKRPQDFDSLIGQEFTVSTLKNAISSGKIANAYLFSGPRGVGKTSAARIMAKALNCLEGPTPNPCGVCSNCVAIQKASSMDVIEIDGASNTSVNDIRLIKDEILFAPSSSKYKIYIIDEVHMLSNSAFNALLKTIEEPPPYIAFIFATTEVHKVPATIRSRCQQFNFRLITTETIAEQLKKVCEENNINADDEALFWIAKEGNGSMRDAYTLFDQILSFSGEHISYEKISTELGIVGLDTINEFAENILAGNRKLALEEANNILIAGISIEQFVIDLAEYFRNILFIKSGITARSILGYNSQRYSQKVIDELEEFQIEEALSIILATYKTIKFSLNQRYEFELLVSKLCSVRDKLTNQALVQEIMNLKDSIFSGDTEIQYKPKTVASSKSASTSTVATSNASTSSTTTNNAPKEEKSFSLKEAFEQELKKKKINDPVDEKPKASINEMFQVTKTESVVNEVFQTVKTEVAEEAVAKPVEAETLTNEAKQEASFTNSDEIVKRLVKELELKYSLLAASLDSTVSSRIEGNTLNLLFNNPYFGEKIENDAILIRKKIREIYNIDLAISVAINQTPPSSKKKEQKKYDQTIETIKELFRGEVLEK